MSETDSELELERFHEEIENQEARGGGPQTANLLHIEDENHHNLTLEPPFSLAFAPPLAEPQQQQQQHQMQAASALPSNMMIDNTIFPEATAAAFNDFEEDEGEGLDQHLNQGQQQLFHHHHTGNTSVKIQIQEEEEEEGPYEEEGQEDDVESSDDEVPASLQFEQHELLLDDHRNNSNNNNQGNIFLHDTPPPSPNRQQQQTSNSRHGVTSFPPQRQQYDLAHVNRINNGRIGRRVPLNGTRSGGGGGGGGAGGGGPASSLQSNERSPSIMGWKDVYNMDEFLQRLYQYYEGHGYVCIILAAISNLLSIIFIVSLTLFLTECIDYNLIPTSKRLDQVLVPQCLSKMRWSSSLIAFGVGSWWIYLLIRTTFYSLPRLLEIRAFVSNVLEITEEDLQTMLWSDVVTKIVTSYETALRQMQATGRKLDAHIIANRIMRKENFIIAMFNKEILELRIPFLGSRQWLTRMMQDYIIYYGVFGFVFDEKGNFRKRFLKPSNRARLTFGLQKRFQKMALFALVLSPILFIYLIVQSFFKLSEEYRQNPGLLGARAYSPLAMWKMREFNELPHIFNKRLARSHECASLYMNQFPNHMFIIIARFISFVSASIATVLLIITLFEEELQQGFEITPSKSALFYIGIFGSILAVTQGMTQTNVAHEPQRWMNAVVLDTHYLPEEWRDKAHTPLVRDQFSILFDSKIAILLYELFSVLLVPVLLYTSIPNSAGKIVDFIREFTVNAKSVGHICSFAVFDLEKHGNAKFGAKEAGGHVDEHLLSKDGKMEQSFMNFKANNPDWDAGLRGSEYLNRIIQRRTPLRSNLGPHHLLSSRLLSTTGGGGGGGGVSSNHSDLPFSSSQLDGSESIIASVDGRRDDMGRELIGLLDAFYKNTRT